MPSTGNIFVVTGENNAGIGATAWTNPGNIVSDDTNDATCAAAASSQYLVGRNCGFAIPSGATIKGVTVRVEASEHSGGTEALLAQLQNNSGSLFGTSKSASNGGNISGTSKSVYTYGSTSDLWGATITPAIVNDADFGVRLWFATAHDVRIDYVTIAIEYTNAYSLTCDPASFALTGQAATVIVQRKIACSQGAFLVTEQDAGVRAQRKLTVSDGSFSLTGQDSTLRHGYRFSVDAGSFAITDQSATFRKTSVLSADPGNLTLSGQDAGLKAQRSLVAGAGSFSFSGSGITLLHHKYFSTGAGIFSLNGVDAGLRKSSILQAVPGAFNISGQTAGLFASRTLSVAAGVFSATGADADLVYTPSSGGNYTLNAQPFSILFTGQGATLTYSPYLETRILYSAITLSVTKNSDITTTKTFDSRITVEVNKTSEI